mmetsp:Transcript_14891/g.30331  ORF Transcript_14891/g.30331 Transcript_14891/m.30331 type:complete len:180 (+) Transcript_14891:238-777(+)
MAASLARLLNTMPLPLFGSARTAAAFTIAKARALPRFAGWALPLATGALWFVWPAVDEQWKIDMGIKADPEAAAKAAAAAEEEAKKSAPVQLSAEATKKVETAYKAHVVEETDDDKLLAEAAKKGDFSFLEDKWEAFNEKAIKPGEDDDDEEEENDEEDDDDEGEGDEGGDDDDDDDDE